MIGRRGFITGVAALVAAPAVARAAGIEMGVWQNVFGQHREQSFIDRTFDFTKMDGGQSFDSCYFACCRFLIDETTRFSAVACMFDHCAFEGGPLDLINRFDRNFLSGCSGFLQSGTPDNRGNWHEESGPQCVVPVS